MNDPNKKMKKIVSTQLVYEPIKKKIIPIQLLKTTAKNKK